ncbi:MAG: DUF5696 domain-containing protein [Lachnospiraceae bacterium]|nr:DUF5696 domain-containing protein [Lachnospiraceae bacterium]
MKIKKTVKTALALALIAAFLFSAGNRTFAYIATGRDTKMPPVKSEAINGKTDDFNLIYENDKIAYYWRDDRDVLAIKDKETGYVMKTGADFPFANDIKDKIKKLKKQGVSDEELIAAAEDYAGDLNATYVGIANSFLTIEYFSSDKIKYISSASESGAFSELTKISDGKFKLAADFEEIEVSLNIYLDFTKNEIQITVPSEEIKGNGKKNIAAFDFCPFLGASGGVINRFNPVTLEYEKMDNYRVPGYVLVPDGSGALIRFNDNTAVFDSYIGDVYGKDYATETYYKSALYDDVPAKDPVMPVFGIAHGNGQMAFVSWADEGAEYMDIIVNHDGSKGASYTWAYPRFEKNVNFFQLYDEKGNGFFKQMDDIFDYDISLTYSFLFGDGSDGDYPADYVGMALEYREHLMENGVINEMKYRNEDIPIRLDFIMGDAEKGLFGTKQVVATTTDEVEEILSGISEGGIKNINSGLIGWQKKGESLNKPYEMNFTGSIGSKNDFKSLISKMADKGIDVSFAREAITINKKMAAYSGNAVKAISNWYVSVDKSEVLPAKPIISTFSYINPETAAKWVLKLNDKVSDFSKSLTLSGISNVLTSHYNRDGVVTSLTESLELYEKTLGGINQDLMLNLENPNQYLWKYTDRYLQMPVGGSQFIYENDSVPFLQLVLCGTMEMYAPYANFSFYTDDCVLRMIDYNLSPSFILSKAPSYVLSDSFYSYLYSTEYVLYEDKIYSIYNRINSILSEVSSMDWVGRTVPENDVVINSYKDGNTQKHIIINYTEKPVTYMGITVNAESAAVVK